MKSRDIEGETSHHIAHMNVSDDFSSFQLNIASEFVKQKLEEKYTLLDLMTLRGKKNRFRLLIIFVKHIFRF